MLRMDPPSRWRALASLSYPILNLVKWLVIISVIKTSNFLAKDIYPTFSVVKVFTFLANSCIFFFYLELCPLKDWIVV